MHFGQITAHPYNKFNHGGNVKLLSATLSALLLALAIGYGALYIDYKNLANEFAFQQTNYEQRLATQAKQLKDNSENSRLINPHARMISTPEASTNGVQPKHDKDELDALHMENIARSLEQKYAILFNTLPLSKQEQTAMRKLLMERERILNTSSVSYFSTEADIKTNIETQQTLVTNVDRQITQLLRPEDAHKYQLLKDSAYEQFQMNSFYDQLGDKAAVNEATRNNLLLSKLEQKQAFAQQLQHSADAIASASPEEKKYLAEKMREALHDYKDNYLRNAKASLNEEQFNALREYEQNQFNEIWQSLQAGWQIEE